MNENTVEGQETNNATVTPETTAQDAPRMFTQEEVDKIVGDRLKRDRAKAADEAFKLSAELDAANKRAEELQTTIDAMTRAEEVRQMRERIAAETGVPASLLNESDEDACRQQAERIRDYATPKSYPAVNDGGEITNTIKPTTRQQFAEWAQQAFN